MQSSPISKIVVSLMVVLLAACSSSPKKPVIEIEKVVVSDIPKLTPEHKALYTKAIDQMKANSFEQAQSIFEELLIAYPKLAGAYVNLAIIDESNGETDNALIGYDKALSLNSNNVDALIQSALIVQRKGNFSLAESKLRKAHAIDKLNTRVNYNLGVLYELYLQDYDLAIQHYEAYIEHSSADDVKIVGRWIKMLERK